MADLYSIERVAPADLNQIELEACIALVSDGGAVEEKYPRAELPLATVLVVARTQGGQIVGVGAIKRERVSYARGRAALSGHRFNPRTLELGYVAVENGHRRRGLSGRIISELLAHYAGPLWATTDHQDMKEKLSKAKFSTFGKEWEGGRGMLSLWLKL